MLTVLFYKAPYPFFFLALCAVACGILVPQPGIERMPPAVEVRNFNNWTLREVPLIINAVF